MSIVTAGEPGLTAESPRSKLVGGQFMPLRTWGIRTEGIRNPTP